MEPRVESNLLSLSAHFRRNIRFYGTGGRFKGVRDVSSMNNGHVRETAQFMMNHGILCGYHKIEANMPTLESLSELKRKRSAF